MNKKPNQMRYTIIDQDETISFAGGGHLLKALAAACAAGARNVRDVLLGANTFDDGVEQEVLTGLAVFDELVLAEDDHSIQAWLERPTTGSAGVFRVFNQELRNLSLKADSLGIVLFNLADRRIVQIENHYGNLQREDRSRYRKNGMPTRMTYAYALPDSWRIVP